jgi:hypothetical protein
VAHDSLIQHNRYRSGWFRETLSKSVMIVFVERTIMKSAGQHDENISSFR